MQQVTPEIGDAFRPVETALKETFVADFSRDWAAAYQSNGSPACQSNRWDWPFLTPPRRPLRTGWRPVSSQDT